MNFYKVMQAANRVVDSLIVWGDYEDSQAVKRSSEAANFLLSGGDYTISDYKKEHAQRKRTRRKGRKLARWMPTKKFWNQYRLYLRSEQWLEKREEVLLRARYVCELCKEREASQVHHRTYERVFDERLEDLQALCSRCHKRAHKKRGG